MDASEIAEGKCYLGTSRSQVRRVFQVLPDRRVLYDTRSGSGQTLYWRPGGIIDVRVFAALVEREVPCDWIITQKEN